VLPVSTGTDDVGESMKKAVIVERLRACDRLGCENVSRIKEVAKHCMLRCEEAVEGMNCKTSDCVQCQSVIPAGCPYRLELLMLEQKC